jgi:hypothetical protein
MSAHLFEDRGVCVTGPLLEGGLCDELEAALLELRPGTAGTRNLLPFAWCAAVAKWLRLHPDITPLLPHTCVAVQCTLFDKSTDRNWLVPVHQDLGIPVSARTDHPALTGWSEKAGSWFVHPPASVLEQMVAVRVHVDECGPADGPLRVVPGSHRNGRISSHDAAAQRQRCGEITCEVARGAALLIKPIVLHASSRATGSSRRRVLHFVYGPPTLPYGLQWRYAV